MKRASASLAPRAHLAQQFQDLADWAAQQPQDHQVRVDHHRLPGRCLYTAPCPSSSKTPGRYGRVGWYQAETLDAAQCLSELYTELSEHPRLQMTPSIKDAQALLINLLARPGTDGVLTSELHAACADLAQALRQHPGGELPTDFSLAFKPAIRPTLASDDEPDTRTLQGLLRTFLGDPELEFTASPDALRAVADRLDQHLADPGQRLDLRALDIEALDECVRMGLWTEFLRRRAAHAQAPALTAVAMPAGLATAPEPRPRRKRTAP